MLTVVWLKVLFFFPDNTQYQNVLKECQRTNFPNMLVPHLAHIIVVKKNTQILPKRHYSTVGH